MRRFPRDQAKSDRRAHMLCEEERLLPLATRFRCSGPLPPSLPHRSTELAFHRRWPRNGHGAVHSRSEPARSSTMPRLRSPRRARAIRATCTTPCPVSSSNGGATLANSGETARPDALRASHQRLLQLRLGTRPPRKRHSGPKRAGPRTRISP